MANTDVSRVAGNIGALNALYSLQNINTSLATHQTRLATGKRINESADDPSGMHLATTFDVRRGALKVALTSIGDAKNLMSTAEGGLKKVQDILVKMRNKASEAQSDTIGAAEREVIKSQLTAYRDEINDIVAQTQWNGVALLNGNTTAGSVGTTADKTFLTGDGAGVTSDFGFKVAASNSGCAGSIQAGQSFASDTTGTKGDFAGVTGKTGLQLSDANLNEISGSTASARAVTYNSIDAALSVVKQGISQIGNFTARMTFKEEALMVQHANTESAYNRIMNANMAEEQVEASKFMILQQTSTAMLSQANAAPQFLLSLFR